MKFGAWTYDHKLMTLTFEPYGYEIDLEEITSSAGMLDWLFQIWHKDWGRQHFEDLMRAFDKLLDPQANLCSWGNDHAIDAKKILSSASAPHPMNAAP